MPRRAHMHPMMIVYDPPPPLPALVAVLAASTRNTIITSFQSSTSKYTMNEVK
jgi:hypothetical protein